MRQKIVITKLLKSLTEVYYQVWQKFITKCGRSLLQSPSGITKCGRLLLHSGSGITKYGSYYKVRRSSFR